MVKFGLALPYTDARMVARLARQAEDAGWDGVFLGDAVWTLDPIVSLAAAAMVTSRIRLGTMVIPVPLRRPWKIAGEAANLDLLSGGRAILGLGTGAVWMGWQGFPDEVTGVRERAEMLDESIDILDLLFRREPFDFDGKHYHLKLTRLDPVYYPPRPVQQPRIPLWCVGAWPRMKSMERVLKCDGLLPVKMNTAGKFEDLQPADVVTMKAYVDAHRTLTTPFDIVIEGSTTGLDPTQARDKVLPWVDAGATWWIEGMWGATEAEVSARILQGPPPLN
jgi:hypothetical protein